jgi:hypothetical protein
MMNFQELTTRLRLIEGMEGNVAAAAIGAGSPELDDGMEEGFPVAPTKDDQPGDKNSEQEGLIIGGPMPGMMPHAEQPKQQDNVTMSVSMNGSGPGGISDLMKILRNIEDSDNKDPHQHDVSKLFSEPHDTDHEEPIMGDIVATLSREETDGEDSPMTHEYEVGETMDDDEESWGNSPDGASGHHTHGVDAVTFSGDDMNSKGKSSPAMRVPGSNTLRGPTNVSETLVGRLQTMYEAIKEERTEEKDEKGNVVRWKEEGEWTKKTGKDGRGKVTNLSDKARRESEKMSKKETEVAEGGWTLPPADASPEERDAIMQRNKSGQDYINNLASRQSNQNSPAQQTEFVPHDYQTKEPLQKDQDGKWRNSKGEERDGFHGGPVNPGVNGGPSTARFRSLVPLAPKENIELAEMLKIAGLR